MGSQETDRRAFLSKAAKAGLAAAIATSKTRPILGANDRVTMGIIGSGGMGRHHMGKFKDLGAEWAGVADVYDINLQKGLDLAGPGAKPYSDYRRLLEIRTLMPF
jgi:hypothetical protein